MLHGGHCWARESERYKGLYGVQLYERQRQTETETEIDNATETATDTASETASKTETATRQVGLKNASLTLAPTPKVMLSPTHPTTLVAVCNGNFAINIIKQVATLIPATLLDAKFPKAA